MIRPWLYAPKALNPDLDGHCLMTARRADQTPADGVV
jgi:hypothetical protein